MFLTDLVVSARPIYCGRSGVSHPNYSVCADVCADHVLSLLASERLALGRAARSVRGD